MSSYKTLRVERYSARRQDSSETSEEGEDNIIARLRRERSPGNRHLKRSGNKKSSGQSAGSGSSKDREAAGRSQAADAAATNADDEESDVGSPRIGSRMAVGAFIPCLGDGQRETTGASAASTSQAALSGGGAQEQQKMNVVESEEDCTPSSTEHSRRCSDSDSGVNLSPIKGTESGFENANSRLLNLDAIETAGGQGQETGSRSRHNNNPRQLSLLQPGSLDESETVISSRDSGSQDSKQETSRSSYGSQKSPRQGRSKTRWEESTQHKSYSSSVPMAGLPMAGALFGVCLGGPVGMMAGIKLGGVVAVGGSILGYTGAKVISDHVVMREYMDDHYKKNPEIFVKSPREEKQFRRRGSAFTPPDSPRYSTSPVRSREGDGPKYTGRKLPSPGGLPPKRGSVSAQSLYRSQYAGKGAPGRFDGSPAPLRRAASTRSTRGPKLSRRQNSVDLDLNRTPRSGKKLPTPRPYRRFQDQTEEEKESLSNLINKGGHIPPVCGPNGGRGVPILATTSANLTAPTQSNLNPRSAPITKSNPYSSVFQNVTCQGVAPHTSPSAPCSPAMGRRRRAAGGSTVTGVRLINRCESMDSRAGLPPGRYNCTTAAAVNAHNSGASQQPSETECNNYEEEDEDLMSAALINRRRRNERTKRTCSLPDVLEEDSLSNKS